VTELDVVIEDWSYTCMGMDCIYDMSMRCSNYNWTIGKAQNIAVDGCVNGEHCVKKALLFVFVWLCSHMDSIDCYAVNETQALLEGRPGDIASLAECPMRYTSFIFVDNALRIEKPISDNGALLGCSANTRLILTFDPYYDDEGRSGGDVMVTHAPCNPTSEEVYICSLFQVLFFCCVVLVGLF